MADSVIQQLVHRKMFRITAGYLAVAWANGRTAILRAVSILVGALCFGAANSYVNCDVGDYRGIDDPEYSIRSKFRRWTTARL